MKTIFLAGGLGTRISEETKKIPKPMIKIGCIKSYYGSWCEKTRSITLSEELLNKYPWEIVLEVLKHEMAHQYVSEILKKEDQHGPFFKEACRILRVKHWAQRACLSLDSCLFEKEKNFSNLENLFMRFLYFPL